MWTLDGRVVEDADHTWFAHDDGGRQGMINRIRDGAPTQRAGQAEIAVTDDLACGPGVLRLLDVDCGNEEPRWVVTRAGASAYRASRPRAGSAVGCRLIRTDRGHARAIQGDQGHRAPGQQAGDLFCLCGVLILGHFGLAAVFSAP